MSARPTVPAAEVKWMIRPGPPPARQWGTATTRKPGRQRGVSGHGGGAARN